MLSSMLSRFVSDGTGNAAAAVRSRAPSEGSADDRSIASLVASEGDKKKASSTHSADPPDSQHNKATQSGLLNKGRPESSLNTPPDSSPVPNPASLSLLPYEPCEYPFSPNPYKLGLEDHYKGGGLKQSYDIYN